MQEGGGNTSVVGEGGHMGVEGQVKGAAVCVFTVTSLVSNSCVLATVVRHDRLHTLSCCLMAALAATDILQSMVWHVCALASLLDGRLLVVETRLCGVLGTVLNACISASAILSATVALDRYVFVANPMRYPSLMTCRRVLAALGVGMVLACLVALAPPLGLGNYAFLPHALCCVADSGWWYVTFGGLVFVPASMVMAVSYGRLWRICSRQLEQDFKRENLNHSLLGRTLRQSQCFIISTALPGPATSNGDPAAPVQEEQHGPLPIPSILETLNESETDDDRQVCPSPACPYRSSSSFNTLSVSNLTPPGVISLRAPSRSSWTVSEEAELVGQREAVEEIERAWVQGQSSERSSLASAVSTLPPRFPSSLAPSSCFQRSFRFNSIAGVDSVQSLDLESARSSVFSHSLLESHHRNSNCSSSIFEAAFSTSDRSHELRSPGNASAASFPDLLPSSSSVNISPNMDSMVSAVSAMRAKVSPRRPARITCRRRLSMLQWTAVANPFVSWMLRRNSVLVGEGCQTERGQQPVPSREELARMFRRRRMRAACIVIVPVLASWLTVLPYTLVLFLYVALAASRSQFYLPLLINVLSFLYFALVPSLNPVLYGLTNRDFRSVLRASLKCALRKNTVEPIDDQVQEVSNPQPCAEANTSEDVSPLPDIS